LIIICTQCRYKPLNLFCFSFQRGTSVNILAGLDDIQAVIDDHFIKTVAIRGSAFVKPIESEVKEWFDTVNRMNMTLEEWARMQIKWLYLMPIFSSPDIVAQMPEEGILFHVRRGHVLFGSILEIYDRCIFRILT